MFPSFITNSSQLVSSQQPHSGTAASNSVPHPDEPVPLCATNLEDGCKGEGDIFLYDFEERLAIAEYDDQKSPLQAERIAYLGAFISILFTLTEDNPHKDWLTQQI